MYTNGDFNCSKNFSASKKQFFLIMMLKWLILVAKNTLMPKFAQ